MQVNHSEKLGRLTLLITATVLVNNVLLPQAQARPVDLDTLCQKFPLNSRCQGYKSLQERQNAVNQAPQVIKLRLNTSASREWILIKTSGNTVQLRHTTNKVTTFSRLTHFAVGFSPIPIPLPDFYGWHDHQTTRIVFQPDSCAGNSAPSPNQPSSSTPNQPSSLTPNQPSSLTPNQPSGYQSCAMVGTDSITLLPGTDIRQGLFTIDYKERQLSRSITFRLPANTKLASDKHKQNNIAREEK